MVDVACCMLQRKSKAKSCYHCIIPLTLRLANEAMKNAVSQRCPKKGVCWIRKPAISSCFGCWAVHTRSYTIQKGCVQAMWNGYFTTTARILPETKGKAMEWRCSSQSLTQTEKEMSETKRKNTYHTIWNIPTRKKKKSSTQCRPASLFSVNGLVAATMRIAVVAWHQ